MTDYSELVKALRCCDEYALCNDCPIFETCDGDVDKAMAIAAAAIEALQAQLPKQGKWIDDEFGAKCSYCGKYAYWSKYEIPWKSPYCPICGAKMTEVQDEV